MGIAGLAHGFPRIDQVGVLCGTLPARERTESHDRRRSTAVRTYGCRFWIRPVDLTGDRRESSGKRERRESGKTGPEWRDFPLRRRSWKLTSFTSRIAFSPKCVERTDRAGLARTARSAPYSIACRRSVTRSERTQRHPPSADWIARGSETHDDAPLRATGLARPWLGRPDMRCPAAQRSLHRARTHSRLSGRRKRAPICGHGPVRVGWLAPGPAHEIRLHTPTADS